MQARTYEVTLSGTSPLLMHWDNLAHADEMDEWKSDPQNKKFSKAGDDRTPAFRWIGCVYNDGERVVMPFENIQRALMEGGAMVPVPGGKNGKTFKSQSQSGIAVPDNFSLTIRGNDIPWEKVFALREEKQFSAHIAKVREMGFSLFVKRARIGQTKHIRVRPRFDNWELKGRIAVFDEQITKEVLNQILVAAGTYKGLGDWRPGSKTPGPFGMFQATMRAAS